MFQKTKKLAVVLVTLGLTFTGITQAQAADLPLTYAQWIASQGFKDLQAAQTLNATKLENVSGVNIDITMDSNQSGQSQNALTGNIKATKTAAVSTITMLGQSMNMSYFNGSYYLTLDDATYSLDMANSASVLKRIPKTATTVNMGADAGTGTSLVDINPSTIFAGSTSNELLTSLLNTDTTKFSFSEITSRANTVVPSSTDYLTEMKLTDPQTGITVDLGLVYTFNSDGFLNETDLNETMSILGMTVTANMKMTMTVNNTIVLVAPDAATVITSTALSKLDHQISAENSLKPTAAKILTKAKALAKTAKKPLSQAHLTAAAKALKISAKSVANGIKVSKKVSGATGNLCVTVVKGAATTKNC